MSRLKRLLTTITGAMAGVLLALTPVLAQGGGSHGVIVTPDDLALPPDLTTTQDSWYFYDDNTNTPTITESPGDYEFSADVAGAKDSASAVKMATDDGERWNIATNQLAGTDLSKLKKLGFHLYVPAASTGGADTTFFLNIDIDFDDEADNGYQGRLIYLPQDNGTVSLDTWQKWDAINSGDSNWQWSGFAGNGNQWPDGSTDAVRSLDDIKDAFPDAEVFNETFTGQTLIRAGHPGPAGLVGYVDMVTLNKTTYDFEEVYPTSGKITSPDEGEEVKGVITLKARYDDGDDDNDDAVQWAVRQGTCDAGVGTVLGNVDGHDDEFMWDGKKFKAEIDTAPLDAGEYCFVFNPTDDPGQNNVRETLNFVVLDNAPENKKDCKHGDWRDFTEPSFDSERECRQFVQGDSDNGNGNGNGHSHHDDDNDRNWFHAFISFWKRFFSFWN